MRQLALLFLSWSIVVAAPAQDAATWKRKGNDLLAAADYTAALEAFLNADNAGIPDAETRTNIGICYFHLHQAAKAEEQLFAAFQAKGTPPPVNFLYLAKLHQARLDFEKAAEYYKRFLKRTPADHPWRPAVRDEIRRCQTGILVRRRQSLAAVIPLADINSPADEFAPIPSPSGREKLYFSANGLNSNGTDVFYSEIEAGDWTAPRPLNRFINGAQDEVALGFNGTADLLYFFRGKMDGPGQLLVDTFRDDLLQGTLFFETLQTPLNTRLGDGGPFFFNDSILLFASRKDGGFGGLDLYVSVRHDDLWSAPANLGPPINSAYDETSPFLSRDGRTLYFSSNDASRSIGGFDVLRSTWLEWSYRWAPPINLGPPINSAFDELHFSLSPGGDRGFFDSDRLDGEGGRDIFVALFHEPREWQLSQSNPVAFCLVPPKKAEGAAPISEQLTGRYFEALSSFELPTIALSPPGGTPSEGTVNQFALLAQLLKRYPELSVTLALHASPADSPMGDFVFASQTVTDLIRQEGVGMGQVTLLFAGSGFPISGSPSDSLSRRAEVFVENARILPFALYRQPLPPDAYKAQFFQKSMASLVYRVEVDATEGLAKLFELYPTGLVEKSPSGQLSFTPGIYLTFAAASEWLRSLTADGYQAEIKPYLRGRALPKAEAAKLVKDFPDLQHFLEK